MKPLVPSIDRGEPASADAHLETLDDKVARLERELAAARAEQLMSLTVLSTTPAIVLRVSSDFTIEFTNRVLPQYRGAPLIGQSVFAFAPPDQHEAMRQALEAAKATRQPTTYQTVALAPDGTRDTYFTTVGPIVDGDALVGLTLLCTNITRLMETEAELHESRTRLEVALDAGRLGLWRWDATVDEVSWDNRLLATFGLTQTTAPRTRADWVSLVPPDQRERMAAHIDEALRTGDYPDFEFGAGTAAARRWFIVRGGPMRRSDGVVVGLMGGVLEVTRLHQLEEQVRHTQKLEAVGQLSAGIAHNFNNMLATIVPVLDLARRGLPVDPTVIGMALQSATQAAELVKELMVFSRRDAQAGGSPEDLEVVVRRAAQLCVRTFARRVRVELGELGPARGVVVDGARTEQAIVNLLVNARDAVDDLDDECRTITVSARDVPEAELRAHHDDAQGAYVELRVADRGRGIDEATRQRIFEPFFTTKRLGQGTGLGLPTAWAAARAQGGFLACESVEGAGTTFLLTVPKRQSAVQGPRPPAHGGTTQLRVLVIDDDPLVLRVTMLLLEDMGHLPRGARSGEEAVQIFRAEPSDVVVLDRSMPGQTPETTLAQLRAIRPGLPIIVFSGLSPGLAGATVELQKPATTADFERALAAAVAARPGRTDEPRLVSADD